MDMNFVGAFELEYGRMVEFSRIIGIQIPHEDLKISFKY